jgi:hypothetical protein
VLAALAIAEPSSAAALLGEMLQALQATTQALATAPADPGSGKPPASAGTGTPRGPWADKAFRATISQLNGAALGVAALLVGSTQCVSVSCPGSPKLAIGSIHPACCRA